MVMALVLLPAGSTSSGLPILLTVGLAITLSGHAAGVYGLDYFARPIEQKLAQRVFTRALRPSLHRLGSSSLYIDHGAASRSCSTAHERCSACIAAWMSSGSGSRDCAASRNSWRFSTRLVDPTVVRTSGKPKT